MAADDSLMSECDFAANDGDVTVVRGDLGLALAGVKLGCGKQDGSDSGIELNSADPPGSGCTSGRFATPLDTPDTADNLDTTLVSTTPPAHRLDYDGTSEGGSESSSVLSSTPVRKRTTLSSSSSTTPCRPAGHPRSRSVAASPATPTPAPRERSAAGRGSSCTRGRPAGSDSTLPRSSRGSRATRTGSGSANLMTCSMTGSMSGSLTLGRCSSRSTPRSAGSSHASHASHATHTAAGDGRWPSTVQRPTTLSGSLSGSLTRGRAASVVTERERERERRMASSSSKNSVNSLNSASTPSPTVESKCDKFSTLPRRRRRRSIEGVGGERTPSSQTTRKPKVTLYHETGTQTALTTQDLDDILGGKACQLRPIDAREQAHQSVQVDREREEYSAQMLDRRLKSIVDVLGFEHSGTPRSPSGNITSTVQTPPKDIDHTEWIRTLELLEQRASIIKKRDLQQRNEIGCLRYEVEQTERLRKRLQSQQEETEAETLELQEFMQVEKAMLAESLKEAEREVQNQKKIAQGLQEELDRQREECQHLVRISEQRRQEILTLEARVARLELQQGAAVSGASVALSALGSRLDDLANQLEESSVEKALSTLTLEAEAVTTRTKEACRPLSIHVENGFQTLDSETEPDLEEEAGGQREPSSADNMDSTRLVNSESIQNLSAAIMFRRLQEEGIGNEANLSDDAPGHLVDQVLDIDTLITRLLRAICDAVHVKVPTDVNATDISSKTVSEAIQMRIETNVHQKIEDAVDTGKSNHLPLLNGSSEGSCSETSSKTVNGRVDLGLATEAVTGAA